MRRRAAFPLFVVLAVVVSGLAGAARPALGDSATEGTLSGTIRDDRGRPLGGAQVALVDAAGGVAGQTTADAVGGYSVSLPEGRYDLEATAVMGSGRAFVAHAREVDVADQADRDLVMIRPGVAAGEDARELVFSGTVRDGHGSPLQMRVELWNLDWNSRSVSTTSSADGTFELRAPAGPYRLSVSSSMQGTSSHRVTVDELVLEEDRHEDLTVPFEEVQVTAADEDGAPVAGTWVSLVDDCHNCPAVFELFPGAGSTTVDWRYWATLDQEGEATAAALPGPTAVQARPPVDYPDLEPVETTVTLPADSIDLVFPTATPPAEPPMVTFEGEIHGLDDWNISLWQDDEKVVGRELSGSGDEFSLEVPAGRYELRLNTIVNTYLGGFTSGDDTIPGLFVSLPGFDLTADRTQDLTVSTETLPVQVLSRDGAPVARMRVSGESGGPDGTAPVELFPGGVGQGLLKNNPRTGDDGVAHLLMFAGAAPPEVRAGLYDIAGVTSLPPGATSAVIHTDAPVLEGTVRDARGPLPWTATRDGWVSFHGGPYGGQFAPWPFGMGSEGTYRLVAQPGAKTLYLSNEEVHSDADDDRVGTSTLPANWHFEAGYDHVEDTRLDLTVPDATPAYVRITDTDGRSLTGTTRFFAETRQPVSLAAGVDATSEVSDVTTSAGGDRHRLQLLDDSDVGVTSSQPGLFVYIRVPMSPGDDVLAMVGQYQSEAGPDTPTAPPASSTTTTTGLEQPPVADPGPDTNGAGDEPKGGVASDQPFPAGYWLLGSNGSVHPFGDVHDHGSVAAVIDAVDGPRPWAGAVDIEPTATGDGYWILGHRGELYTFGDADDLGSPVLQPGEAAASLSATPSGGGYWIFTSLGRVLAYGDAAHHGDMADIPLNGAVLDSVATPSGQGYFMVAADGGIFAFGDAVFAGSMGGRRLNAPVQSLVPNGDGSGYWLVAADGGVFSFDAPFRGSMGSVPLNEPVSGMVRYANGYLMVASDGGIFNFSDLAFVGSLGDHPPSHPIVAVAVPG